MKSPKVAYKSGW